MKKKTKELKKLFISCPTKGRELDNIKNTRARMHKIAEAIFDQELEVINEYPLDTSPVDTHDKGRLEAYNYGLSVLLISQADYFIGIHSSIYFEECGGEANIAKECGLEATFVSVYDIAKDAVDIAAKEMVEECFEVTSESTFDPGNPFGVSITLLSK